MHHTSYWPTPRSCLHFTDIGHRSVPTSPQAMHCKPSPSEISILHRCQQTFGLRGDLRSSESRVVMSPAHWRTGDVSRWLVVRGTRCGGRIDPSSPPSPAGPARSDHSQSLNPRIGCGRLDCARSDQSRLSSPVSQFPTFPPETQRPSEGPSKRARRSHQSFQAGSGKRPTVQLCSKQAPRNGPAAASLLTSTPSRTFNRRKMLPHAGCRNPDADWTVQPALRSPSAVRRSLLASSCETAHLRPQIKPPL